MSKEIENQQHVVPYRYKISSDLDSKPDFVQERINLAYQKVNSDLYSSWSYTNGHAIYKMSLVSEPFFILHQIRTHPDQKEWTIFEAGAGHGAFGRNVGRVIKMASDNNIIPKDIKVTMISANGEQSISSKFAELYPYLSSITNNEYTETFQLIELPNFKVEDIKNEFIAKGIEHLFGKINFFVSRHTIVHMKDKWGTVKGFYDSVEENEGVIIFNGFLFRNQAEKMENSEPFIFSYLTAQGNQVLFRNSDDFFTDGPITIIKKSPNSSFTFPFYYVNNNFYKEILFDVTEYSKSDIGTKLFQYVKNSKHIGAFGGNKDLYKCVLEALLLEVTNDLTIASKITDTSILLDSDKTSKIYEESKESMHNALLTDLLPLYDKYLLPECDNYDLALKTLIDSLNEQTESIVACINGITSHFNYMGIHYEFLDDQLVNNLGDIVEQYEA